MGMEREQDAANENIYRTSSVDLARESERKKLDFDRVRLFDCAELCTPLLFDLKADT